MESLGGCATTRSRETGFQLAYRLAIRLPAQLGSPFLLKRKAAKYAIRSPGWKRPPLRKIESIEAGRTAETQCISVEAEDGLYVTEHYILTHNSWLALGLCVAVAAGGFAFGNVHVEKGSALYLALEDNERRLQFRLKKILARRARSLRACTTPSSARVWTRAESRQ